MYPFALMNGCTRMNGRTHLCTQYAADGYLQGNVVGKEKFDLVI